MLAVILLALFIVFLYLSFCGAGSLSTYYGSAGVMAMLISLAGVVLAVQSLREEDSFRLFPRLGLFFSVVNLVCWAGTYAMGFLLN